MENKLMYVVRSQYDQFTHRVSDLVSLLDLLVGLSGDEAMARRVIKIAKHMRFNDGFATNGIMVTVEREK